MTWTGSRTPCGAANPDAAFGRNRLRVPKNGDWLRVFEVPVPLLLGALSDLRLDCERGVSSIQELQYLHSLSEPLNRFLSQPLRTTDERR